jgi:hypothetical protein
MEHRSFRQVAIDFTAKLNPIDDRLVCGGDTPARTDPLCDVSSILDHLN